MDLDSRPKGPPTIGAPGSARARGSVSAPAPETWRARREAGLQAIPVVALPSESGVTGTAAWTCAGRAVCQHASRAGVPGASGGRISHFRPNTGAGSADGTTGRLDSHFHPSRIRKLFCCRYLPRTPACRPARPGARRRPRGPHAAGRAMCPVRSGIALPSENVAEVPVRAPRRISHFHPRNRGNRPGLRHLTTGRRIGSGRSSGLPGRGRCRTAAFPSEFFALRSEFLALRPEKSRT